MHDLVIRGGTIIDGTGGAPREGDVAIDGGRIASVGGTLGQGRREIDARGRVVAPGFVDVHTHYDGQATWDALLEPSIYHGVTTVVMGNCGVGFAPARPDRHDWLINLMEGVEDIPGTALVEGITWEWESFPEYLDALERMPHSIDIGAQLPHGALRAYVMGDRGGDHTEVPTADEIAEMARLAREAMEAGAVGFSTSRTVNHKDANGRHTPSLTATSDELWGIAEGIGQAGRGVFELVADFEDLEPEFAMVREMSARSGRPMSVTVGQFDARPDDWKRMLELIADANAAGIPMSAQVAPRPVGVIMSLESSVHPFMANAPYTDLLGLPLSERVARLRNPEVRQAIVDDGSTNFDLARLFPLGETPNYEPGPEESFSSRAKAVGVSAIELVLDALIEGDGTGMLFYPAVNYVNGNADHCREMLLHPNAVPGLGDGGAHVSFISDASFPTYLLTHWARDRKRGGTLPLELMIKRQARDTAELVGFLDRGLLAPGMKADVNVIDFDALRIERPELRYDLPAGGKRLIQKATGYDYTIVSGVVVMEDGQATGENPGLLVRGAQPAPRA
jgi:N-acyl-D-aspartate/D-glutamate deacylase